MRKSKPQVAESIEKMVQDLVGEKCQDDENARNQIAKKVYEQIDIEKDGEKIDEFQMFSIVSEITDVQIQRDLSAVFAHMLSRNPDATPEILDQLQKLGKNGVLKSSSSPDSVAPSPPDRKSTRLNSSHSQQSRMPSSA